MNLTAILLATFISTSFVTVVAQVGKGDIYQARIIGFCALVATVASAIKEAELIDFIFAYLLWGCIGGAGGSWIMHRLLDWAPGKDQKYGAYIRANRTEIQLISFVSPL